MKKMDNMKKTVLKLENEISAISLNLAKVQKKEHSKMKNIIQNINRLLNKEEKKNNIHLNQVDKYINKIKNKKKEESNTNRNKYIHTKNKNIDCILISLKKPKTKNKVELNLDDETFFNQNINTSPKLYINKNNQHHLTLKERIFQKNETDFNNYKTNNLINRNHFKNKNKSRNKNNLFFEHLTYSKPKLNNDFSKNNLNKKRNKTNSSNQIVNYMLDINNKIDTLVKDGENDSISNSKNSFSNNKFKRNEDVRINKSLNNLNYINNISNNKRKFDEKQFKKELLYDKKVFQRNELEAKDNKEYYMGNDTKFNILDNDLSLIKSKNIVYDLKSELNKTRNLNKNSIQVSSSKRNKFINTYRNDINNIKKTSTKNTYYIKNEENKNFIKSLEEINQGINDEDLYLNKINIRNNKIIHIKKKNYSRDNNFITNIDTEVNNTKMNKLLNMLKVNDINEAIDKVSKLIQMQKIIHKCKKVYDGDNNDCKNKLINIMEKERNYQWLFNMVKISKENLIYKNFCESIMVNNKIKNFDDFKKFINNILINNRKNNGFLVEVKNILLEEGYYANKRKGKSVNNMHIKKNINNNKKNNNKTFHDLENSNDIKFSRNQDNMEMNEEFRKTYY